MKRTGRKDGRAMRPNFPSSSSKISNSVGPEVASLLLSTPAGGWTSLHLPDTCVGFSYEGLPLEFPTRTLFAMHCTRLNGETRLLHLLFVRQVPCLAYFLREAAECTQVIPASDFNSVPCSYRRLTRVIHGYINRDNFTRSFDLIRTLIRPSMKKTSGGSSGAGRLTQDIENRPLDTNRVPDIPNGSFVTLISVP